MFYIDTHSSYKRREKFLFQILPTAVIFVVFAIIVAFSWMNARQNVIEEQNRTLQQKNAETSSVIKQRMDAYEQILRGGAGLYNASDEVSREEWRNYLETYEITDRYPGIQGVGYVSVVPAKELDTYTQSVRKSGFPDFSIRPAGKRDIYTAITYIEPFKDRNLRAFGYDMYTEPNRRDAMNTARDNGESQMSRLVRLIQEPESEMPQPGFLIYFPVYASGHTPKTTAERRKQLEAYIYLPFRTYDLINNIISTQEEDYGFRMFNVADGNRQEMYSSPTFTKLYGQPKTRVSSTELKVAGNIWIVEGIVNEDVVSQNVSSRPNSLVYGGVLFCLLLAGFVYMLLGNRTRALAAKEELSLQAAKDELLALASHQLRTPATGVKQYVGMLREGFAGKLTATQKKLLDKAYESNERQLTTINEMLFVARTDAGHLRMEKELFSLSDMVSDIAEEQGNTIKQRNQRLQVSVPKRQLYVKGDKQYIRMALENVLSNATKYTRSAGKISVKLKARGNKIDFTVEDTGVGVAPQHQELLFRKFSRIPNELTNQVVGSGIGLYLAKQVIDAHNGSINFESAEEKGSTVTITLPKAVRTTSQKSTTRR